MISILDNSNEFYSLWLYSRNYHNQFLEILNLYEAGFYRPAFNLYYQLFESIIRSYLDDWETRNTSKLFESLSQKIEMSDSDKATLYQTDNSLREVRNKITHRELSSHSFQTQGIDYLFSEQKTYEIIFNHFYPIIDVYINKIMIKSNLGIL